MPMIPLQPDDGHLDAGPTTVPAAHGWLDGAWAQIHQRGSWAEIPKQAMHNKRAEHRNRSAWMSYGIRPTNVLLPQADPVDIRLRLKRFSDSGADRRANVRLLVRDIAAGDPHRSGIRASRARERISRHAQTRPDDVAQAHRMVEHFDRLKDGIGSRVLGGRMTTNVFGVLAVGYMLALGAMAFAPEGPHFRLWQIVLASLVAMACAFQIGRERGWKYGYDQALWHGAEVCAVDALAASQRAEDAAARAQLSAAAAAESAAETARLIRTRRMAFQLPQQPRGEGYLYVVGFSTGSIKVGQTEDPQRRLGQHRNEAKAFGVQVTGYWISPSHMDFRANETRLINRCDQVSTERTRKEYFHDVAYTRAVEFAASLIYHSKNGDQTSVEGVWA